MNVFLISGIILAIGFFICLVLALRAKWKASRKNIDDYQRGRDKLTFRKKKKPKPKKEESSGGFGLGNIIGGFVVILVGLSLLPVVADQVGEVCNNPTMNTTITGASETILCNGAGFTNFIVIAFALGIAGSAIMMVAKALRGSGLL